MCYPSRNTISLIYNYTIIRTTLTFCRLKILITVICSIPTGNLEEMFTLYYMHSDVFNMFKLPITSSKKRSKNGYHVLLTKMQWDLRTMIKDIDLLQTNKPVCGHSRVTTSCARELLHQDFLDITKPFSRKFWRRCFFGTAYIVMYAVYLHFKLHHSVITVLFT